jgi:hypothetical protein
MQAEAKMKYILLFLCMYIYALKYSNEKKKKNEFIFSPLLPAIVEIISHH